MSLRNRPGTPDLEKGIHGLPYEERKHRVRDGIALKRFVTDLNLALELDVTRPLKRGHIQ